MNEAQRRIAALTPEQREVLMRRLREKGVAPAAAPAEPELPRIPEGPVDRLAPVAQTAVQEAYWIGRSGAFDLGGSGANVYLEYEFTGSLWPVASSLNAALRRAIGRHEMLRTVVLPDGSQQVLATVPPYEVEVEDLSRRAREQIEAHLEKVRDEMRYARRPMDRWPRFDVVVHQIDGGRLRLHLRFDAALLDGTTRELLLDELALLVRDPAAELPPLDISFLDFARALADFESTETFRRSRAYWMERLPSLPPSPRLPLARDIGPETVPRIVKRTPRVLEPAAWSALKQRTVRSGITPTSLLTAAFAEVLRSWSDNAEFTLGIVGTYQPPVHPQLRKVVGIFNTAHLLAVEEGPGSFEERARRLQERLAEDLDHQHFPGHRVLRELHRRRGTGARTLLPVYFNSIVELSHATFREEASPRESLSLKEIDLMISLPQVLILCIAVEDGEGGLLLVSQAVEELFPDGLVPDLLDAYGAFLGRLAGDEASWGEARPVRELAELRGPEPGAGELQVLDGALVPRPVWVPGDLWATPSPGAPPVRTGKRARRLPDGGVEILDPERDPGVEALGYGVDLQRVTALLERHPAVRWARVAWRGRLVAHVLPHPGERPDPEELRRHLRAHLPEHRVPSALVFLESLPLRPDGQVDVGALPIPEEPGRRSADPDLEPHLAELAALWEEVLGRRPSSPDDDFFALGGDSLAATRLLARLAERRGGEVAAADLLARPILADMAEALRRAPAPEPARRARRGWLRRTASALAVRLGMAPRETGAGTRRRASYGMRLYTLIWFGQLISTLGSGLGSFALGVWLFQSTQSATRFTLLAFLASVTALVLSPFAGALVDRWDRRRVMILSDSGAGAMTLLMAWLFHTGWMEAWHTYPIVMIMAGFGAFQGPAFGASVRLLVPRDQLVRASGMAQTSTAISRIVGPLLAGGMVGAIGYQGIFLIDFATFLFAMSTLIAVRIPNPPSSAPAERRSLLRDSALGWTYIRERPGLMSLLVLFAITNFSVGIIQVLLTPMILSFGSAADLGTVNSAGAAGALLGSLGLSVWGGPRSRIRGLFLFFLLQGAFLIVGGLRASVPLVAGAAFACMLTGPVINGCSQAIWQNKVALNLQGRVFAIRQMIAFSSMPLAYLVSGPLADHVFGPLLMPGGTLAGSVGRLIGVGEGRGVALLFIVLGALLIVSLLLSFSNPRLRNVERDLPDAL